MNAQDTLRLRVMTYNIRFGELATVDRLAEHIKSFKPDFVALEEVDVNTDRSLAPHQNGRNIISELAGKSNMFGLYGKTINFNKGYYGIAILSRYPYIHVNKLNLPNPQGTEPRVLLEALFEKTEFIAEAIAVQRKVMGGRAVQEAGRETAQASVAQRRVLYILLSLIHI